MIQNKPRNNLLFVVVVITALFALGLRSPEAEAAPFECTIGFYQIISGQLRLLDPDTGTYAPVGPVDASSPNAAGYNIEDDHIYAMGTFGVDVHLIRYEDDGTFTDLGLPTGLPNQSYVAGDMDESGNLWVREFAGSNEIWSIDVSAGTATSLPLSQSIFVSDMVYIDGFLYGLNGPTLTRVNLTTGVVTYNNAIGLVGDVPALSAFGAGWKTLNNRLYFSWNTNGVIYRIDDYETTSPTATPVLQGEIPTSNDGASCPNAIAPIADLSAQDQTETVVQDTELVIAAGDGVLSDATGYDIMLDSYTQPSHGTVIIEDDGSYVYTPDERYVGEDSVTFTITDGFGNTSTATVFITVTPTPTTESIDDETTLADTGDAQWYAVMGATFLLSMGCLMVVGVRRSRPYKF